MLHLIAIGTMRIQLLIFLGTRLTIYRASEIVLFCTSFYMEVAIRADFILLLSCPDVMK